MKTISTTSTHSVQASHKNLGFVLVPFCLIALCAIGVIIAKTNFDIRPHLVLRDPAAVYDIPPYAGAVSIIGVWVLICTGAVTAFTAILSPARRFLLVNVALFSMLLALDDAFMFHEYVLGVLVGIPEVITYIAYGCIFALILISARKLISGTALVLLVLCALSFALSIAADLIFPTGGILTAGEDIAKFAGFLFWCSLWSFISLQSLKHTA
jgi:hypothetical protein